MGILAVSEEIIARSAKRPCELEQGETCMSSSPHASGEYAIEEHLTEALTA